MLLIDDAINAMLSMFHDGTTGRKQKICPQNTYAQNHQTYQWYSLGEVGVLHPHVSDVIIQS